MHRFFALVCILLLTLLAGPLACGADDDAEGSGDQNARPYVGDNDGDGDVGDTDGEGTGDGGDTDGEGTGDGGDTDGEGTGDGGDTDGEGNGDGGGGDTGGDNEFEPTGLINFIVENETGITLYAQESTADSAGPNWVILTNQAGDDVLYSSNCLPESCDDQTQFSCDATEPVAAMIPNEGGHGFAWDGVYYVVNDGCTDVFDIPDEDLSLTGCFGQGELNGMVTNVQCQSRPETVNPASVDPAQPIGLVFQLESE